MGIPLYLYLLGKSFFHGFIVLKLCIDFTAVSLYRPDIQKGTNKMKLIDS